MKLSAIFVLLLSIISKGLCFLEQGKWDFDYNENCNEKTVVKSLLSGSEIFIQVSCSGKSKIKIKWSLNESDCWQEYIQLTEGTEIDSFPDVFESNSPYCESPEMKFDCEEHFLLPRLYASTKEPTSSARPFDGNKNQQTLLVPHTSSKHPVFKITKRGFYKLNIKITEIDGNPFKAKVHIEMRGPNGEYLSAANWPLLPFYGCMCFIYVMLGTTWLAVSFLQWRDLLRIQFWIGGVIFLGMLEVAVFYAEYSSFNSSGEQIKSAEILAEFVSCAKRTLARMLVIIVSLGFGIVKPRLGNLLHRVVGVGALYFILAFTVSYMRIMKPKTYPANEFIIATLPLAVLDSAICWWIFISLAQTTRTLRLRRNLVKLTLYIHFTNILIFSVVVSIIFMLYSIKSHHLTICFTDWMELWSDDAYWRLLFTLILLAIMVLWRPTNNNQRYAFSPLLDNPEDEDYEEDEQFINDAYGVKMRTPGTGNGTSSPKPKINSTNADDDLKWVEENIPASIADSTFPILDSDEEIMKTRFELSKME